MFIYDFKGFFAGYRRYKVQRMESRNEYTFNGEFRDLTMIFITS